MGKYLFVGRNSERGESSLGEERASDGARRQRHCLATHERGREESLLEKQGHCCFSLRFIDQCGAGRRVVLAEIDRLIVQRGVGRVAVLMGALRLRHANR